MNVSSNCGVLCTWYVKNDCDKVNNNYSFEISCKLDTSYHHVRNYVCTLTPNSIAAEKEAETQPSIGWDLGFVPSLISAGKKLQLTEAAIEFINSSITESTRITIEDVDEEIVYRTKMSRIW